MKLIEFIRPRAKLLFKLYLFVLFIFFLQIIVSYIFVYKTSLAQIESSLNALTTRIELDLVYDGKTWDTSLYNADPFTPYPNGSTGFLNPLYIITKEGFVIERSTPVRGLLDTSDYKHLMQFQTPQTIDTITNEKWRVYSQPVKQNGTELGVVVVSYYNPRDAETFIIDKKMKENISFILSQLTISRGKINTNKLDIRNIHYEYSFEVVDIYNNVLINNGRVPTFIDASYFSKEVEANTYRIIRDKKSNDQFMVISRVIRGKNAEAEGIIIAGESVQSLYLILQNYILFALLMSAVCIVPLLIYVVHILRREVVDLLTEKQESNHVVQIKQLYFDKKESAIYIDEVKHIIPYASNQYYICEAIFSSPGKKWEYDELLDRLGDNSSEEINSRKVYDAVLAINKKCGLKIIDYKNKIFILHHPLLTALLKR
jgi:hypothetical protein